MKTSKIIFNINLGLAIFLGAGWVYFYYFILMDDVFRMPSAMTANIAIAGLNALFLASLVLLPFTFRRVKHTNGIRK